MKTLKLYPEYKDNIWGGTRLKEKYGKKTDKSIVAESWELSFHKDGKTRLYDGRTLEEALTSNEIGKNCEGFSFFPVLNKFIDAKDNLSVQVHPSDEYALSKENSFGKTEMWYVVEADEGAGIYLGFKNDTSAEEYEKAISSNTLSSLLNFFPVKSGDCFFIPSGTVHAIGSGCLIYEIQQNSNLTYRVYDYGRKDKDGKERELHIDKALKVSNLKKYEPIKPLADEKNGEYLGLSKYFCVKKFNINSDFEVDNDFSSFKLITCVSGKGSVNDESINTGDSYFITADNNKIKFKGDMTVIMTEIRKYYIGIDLGGTFIKGGITDDLGNILCSDKVPTEADKGGDRVVENIASLASMLLNKLGLTKDDITGLGMGVPGMIDSDKGTVIYSNNLRWRNFDIAKKVEAMTGIKTKIANDANVAVLGEVKFGAARGRKNVIMLTLGTGVGGGIICNGELIEGNRSVGAELGHVVIKQGGEVCSCGRKGCLEAYASATALIRETKRAMSAHKDSKMWEIKSLDEVTGKTSFDYASTDKYANEVVENYIADLATGICNYGNIFRPEIVLLGGGVCAQGDNLLIPLQKRVNEEIYGDTFGPEVKICIASLGNSAGILGAASLWL